MKEKEKQLFKALCKFKDKFTNPSLIEFATPAVLGHLFFNRMQGVAYDVLKSNDLLGKVTLDDAGFFIHLCAHLYKEATTLPWIEMHRDMTLYKYCDIHMMLEETFRITLDESDMNPFDLINVRHIVDLVKKYIGGESNEENEKKN